MGEIYYERILKKNLLYRIRNNIHGPDSVMDNFILFVNNDNWRVQGLQKAKKRAWMDNMNYIEEGKKIARMFTLFNGNTRLAILLAIRDNPMHSTNKIGTIIGRTGAVLYNSVADLRNKEYIQGHQKLVMTTRGKMILDFTEKLMGLKPKPPRIVMEWIDE